MAEKIDKVSRFPTTMWTLVGRAGLPTELQREALEELLQRYLPALKAHLVVKRRIDSHDAEDLLQGFVHDKILQRDLLASAQASRGRFRSLLATALDNYVFNQFDKRKAKKRRPDTAASFDQHQELIPTETAAPGHALDVAWAREVLRKVVENMQRECQRAKRDDLWHVFEARVLNPILCNERPMEYDQIVKQFGFQTPTQACDALKTAKRMFSRHLRETVSQYVADQDELEQEIRELGQALSQAGISGD